MNCPHVCPAKVKGWIAHFCEVLDIPLGYAEISKLVDAGILKTPVDIFEVFTNENRDHS